MPDGTVLLNCWAGCDTQDVLAALGLDWADLWERAERDQDRLDEPRVRKVVPAHLRHAMEAMLSLEQAA